MVLNKQTINKKVKDQNCKVEWHFHYDWWMNFNCQDFIFDISLIQTVSLQGDARFVCSHVCVHACVCVGGGRFVTVDVWASDGVGVIWKWCECFFVCLFVLFVFCCLFLLLSSCCFKWKSLEDKFRTVSVVHLSYYFTLKLDVIYEIWIHLITFSPPQRVVTLWKCILGNHFWPQSS